MRDDSRDSPAMHVCAKAAAMIDERGFLAVPRVGKTGATGPLTLHQAMRRACGLRPDAWLPAYVDWRQATAPYREAIADLSAEVVRVSGERDPALWASRARGDEVVALLRTVAEASDRGFLDPESPAPRLRPGCDQEDSVFRVAPSGVLASTLCVTARALGKRAGATAVEACRATEAPLSDIGNVAFLDALVELDPSASELPPESDELGRVLSRLSRAASLRTDYRVPRLLASLMPFDPTPIDTITDGALADALDAIAAEAAPPEKGDPNPRFRVPEERRLPPGGRSPADDRAEEL